MSFDSTIDEYKPYNYAYEARSDTARQCQWLRLSKLLT